MTIENFEGSRYLSEALQFLHGIDGNRLKDPIAKFSEMVAGGVRDVNELARPFECLEVSMNEIQYRIEGVLLSTEVIETPQESL